MAVQVYQISTETTTLDVPYGLTRDITLSIEYYLRTKQVARDGHTQSLFDFFRDSGREYADLQWLADFPDDIGRVRVPALALSSAPDMGTPEMTTVAGGHFIQEPRRYTLWGFAGGETATSTYKDNRAQRTALMDDLFYLFNGSMYSGVVIDLYHFSSDGNIDTDYSASTVRIADYSAAPVGATGPSDPERFRFMAEFTVSALTSRSK